MNRITQIQHRCAQGRIDATVADDHTLVWHGEGHVIYCKSCGEELPKTLKEVLRPYITLVFEVNPLGEKV